MSMEAKDFNSSSGKKSLTSYPPEILSNPVGPFFEGFTKFRKAREKGTSSVQKAESCLLKPSLSPLWGRTEERDTGENRAKRPRHRKLGKAHSRQ